ncbi:hypothetical protein MY5147_002181 [Beauveria neobassiana]
MSSSSSLQTGATRVRRAVATELCASVLSSLNSSIYARHPSDALQMLASAQNCLQKRSLATTMLKTLVDWSLDWADRLSTPTAPTLPYATLRGWLRG